MTGISYLSVTSKETRMIAWLENVLVYNKCSILIKDIFFWNAENKYINGGCFKQSTNWSEPVRLVF